MKRSVHSGAFLIVEGATDATVFKNLIDQEECRIEIGFGKHNVINAIRTLNATGFRGALAVADADFRNIQSDGVNEPNLEFTDEHDLECMILRSSALDRVLAEFGTDERVEAFAKRHGPLIGYSLARSASALGCLLLVSLNNDHGLIFDELPFARFINPESLQPDFGGMLTEVRNRSQKHSLNWAVIEEDVRLLQEAGHDPWQVCCGHHVIEILAVGFRRVFASHTRAEVTANLLAKCLRLAFGVAEFVATKLYQSLRAWEKVNTPYRILPAI
jgi:hypothetical protein